MRPRRQQPQPGDIFTSLHVLQSGAYRSLVECTCGKQFIADNNALLDGNTTSCGCARIARMKARRTQQQ